MSLKIIFLLCAICFFYLPVAAEPWNLPQELNNQNAEVTFEVDSTWHLVHGVARTVVGRLWLADAKDYHSIRGHIRLPVAAFDTDSENRDEKLRKVMHSSAAPEVIVELVESLPALCDPQMLSEGQPCHVEIPANLTINAITKRVTLTSEVSRQAGSYRISGATTIRWADYRVDDPSIFIAKLHDEVKIQFSVTLNSES